MDNNEELLGNLDKIHTTEMGMDRIRNNLGLAAEDVVVWCKERISSADCQITRRGKNWYAKAGDCIITINAGSCTIITAHRLKQSNLADWRYK